MSTLDASPPVPLDLEGATTVQGRIAEAYKKVDGGMVDTNMDCGCTVGMAVIREEVRARRCLAGSGRCGCARGLGGRGFVSRVTRSPRLDGFPPTALQISSMRILI